MVDWSLYVITDRQAAGSRSITQVIEAAIAGGATIVQMREKGATTRELIALGRALHKITRVAGVPLIINDRVDIALALDAEGVHVGQDDMPAPIARRLLGPERILGVSAGTVEEARQAERDGASYLGVGDVYGTPSKQDAGVPIGVEGLREIAEAVSIPVIGIGGINANNAAAVIEAGAAGVAVISTVVGSQDPQATARKLREIICQARQRSANSQRA
ncbi:MAG: thiamine phosphate synthase [Chloroflexota bacterium]|nr:thiamine phosphate synthase [Chloroflexota bacterium]